VMQSALARSARHPHQREWPAHSTANQEATAFAVLELLL
jgi:hypothetical protein